MKFELGKFYKTRDGRKAQIFMLDNGAEIILGMVQNKDNIWFSNQWRTDGRIYHNHETPNDLVGEWREPIKKVMEVWIDPMQPIENHKYSLQLKLGINNWDDDKTDSCTIRTRITLEEVPE